MIATNGVRTLQSAAEFIRAHGEYTLVRVDPDVKYQSGELIVIGASDIERPPILTGVVVSTGKGRQRKRSVEPSPYAAGDRVPFCRGEGYASWKERDADGDEHEYRVVHTFDQLLGFTLDPEPEDKPHTNVRMKLSCQSGVMD